MEYIKIEVAIEIISMYIAFCIENNNLEKIKVLNEEKEKIYDENQTIINKVINEYGKQIKKHLEEKNGR